MEATYFTCTLGEAVLHQDGKSYNNISDFIEQKAQTSPGIPVVGFYEVDNRSQSQWKPHILTFKDIQRGTSMIAEALSRRIAGEQGQTVALLCPSSAGFLFTWLALIWLGHPALLIAPQCSPSAVARLCKSCNAKYLIHDDVYEDLATNAKIKSSKLENESLSTLLLPSVGQNIFEMIKRTSTESTPGPVSVKDTDIAYLHHSSGTSSGTPKPIPQSHKGAIGILPILDGQRSACFTTTPLYHGGVADLFRAWTSNGMIWLFPGKEIPTTAANTRKCLESATTWASDTSGPPVKYFSSVPYVLQMMAEDSAGLKHLQQMDIVGVGGAALPAEVGDNLVRKDVNLISRFGSAECGFLMSSHRDYAEDKEWQYLRSTPGGRFLRFEAREDNLSELIVQADWPNMAKRNRDDGSYATADLFAPHPEISDAWRYHSRADSQLTLVTGKKFDPAPLEDALRASASDVTEDVLIFANGRPYPGVLLFRTPHAANMSDQDLMSKVAPRVERLNRDSQSHARIPRNMLIPMPHLTKKLEKSSKGTTLRNKAEERFAKEIAAAYESVLPSGNPTNIPDTEVPERIRDVVLKVAGESGRRGDGDEELTDETDLFNYGVDSVACIQIRHALSRLVPGGTALPLTVVHDAGNISQLSEFVLRMRSGKDVKVPKSTNHNEQEQHRLMLDLAKQYSVFKDHRTSLASTKSSSLPRPSLHRNNMQVLLTGPTGSLGAHILSQLLSNPTISKIHLLVRGATPTASRERVFKALTSRKLPIPEFLDAKLQVHNYKLSDPKLGLSWADYDHLAESVDVIIHLAWSVNFLLPLRSFASTHVAGVRNLIDFALSSSKRSLAPRFIFCSSVAAVSNHSSSSRATNIPEKVLPDPAASGPTGYARSKWVAEQLCAQAHETTPLKNRISVARVGQLSGATDSGVWAPSEAYPLMLSSLKVSRCLPDLDRARRDQGAHGGEVLGWLPVDIAAGAFVEDIVGNNDSDRNTSEDVHGKVTEKSVGANADANEMPVHHVLNPSTDVTWSDLLSWLSHKEDFETVSANEWLSRLEALQNSEDEGQRNHPALKLLSFWREAYGSKQGSDEAGTDGGDNDVSMGMEETARATSYEMVKTCEAMPSLRNVEDVVNEEYVLKLWEWIQENV